VNPLDLARRWPKPSAGYVTSLRLHALPNPHRALALRLR